MQGNFADLFENVGEQMLLKISRNTFAQMTIVDSKQTELLAVNFREFGDIIIFHWMISFPFHQAVTKFYLTIAVFSFPRTS